MKVGIAEYLKEAASKRSKADRIEALRSAVRKDIQVFSMLKYMFKTSIIFALPPGKPPATLQPKASDLRNVLYAEFRRIKIFMRGEYPQMKPAAREMHFVQLLESVDPDDAMLLVAMKDKTSPFRNLTKELVMEAFPVDTKGW